MALSTASPVAAVLPRSTPVVAVVVPCYRERSHILEVLARIGPEVSRIVVVDDACPEGSGAAVAEHAPDSRIDVIVHERNQGVGAATLSGYQRAIEAGADIIVKLDGDGQMDPALIPGLIRPIAEGKADYTKGNRFHRLAAFSQMPAARIAGNLALSFLSKLSSGYWNVFDCTNGFTAIHAKVARLILEAPVSRRYFFESDMLFQLGLLRAVVADVPMEARYGSETSGVSLWKAVFEFGAKHAINWIKRLFVTYFMRDFSLASFELVLGQILFLFGIVFGIAKWHLSIETGVPATAGTVLLAGLPVLLGSQLLIAFLGFDVRNVPTEALHPRLP
jgi:dolichol-phosphate mannosyltransferase